MLIQQILGPVYLIDSPYHGSQGILGTYVVKGVESILIDPGPSSQVPGVLEGLRTLGITCLLYVGLTHIHLDHGGGAWKLVETYPEAEVYAHPKAEEHLVDPSRIAASAKQFFGPAFDRYGEVRGITHMKIRKSIDGEVLDLQGAKLKVIWTPGHASHGQSFWEPDYKIIILGDCGGSFSKTSGNIFPITPPPFNLEKALDALDRLIALRPEIVCYSHFGYSYDAVKKLIYYKNKLQDWADIVEKGVEEDLDIYGIWELLKEQDPLLRQTFEGNDSRRKMAIPNIIGLLDYTKWKSSHKVQGIE